MAVIANVALTNTFETWRTRTNIGFTRLNQFAINEASLYANTITANVAFTSKGAVTHQTTMLQTGAAVFGSTIRYGGVTLANTATGTGGLVLKDSPILTGTLRYGGVTLANTVTGTGSLVLSASPTFTGSVTVAGLRANSSLGTAGYFLRTNGTNVYWDALPALSNYALLSGAVFSGAVVLGTTLRYGGVTLANTVTGTGSMVLSAAPTITGHPTIEGVTATGATGTGKFVFDGSPIIASPVFSSTIRYGGVTLANTVTGTGSLVLATSPSVTTLTVSSGGLTVTAGGATVTAGGVTVANGNIALAGNKLVNYTENATAYTNLTGSVTVPTNSNVVRYTVTGTATLTLPAGMPNQSTSVKNIIIVLKENATGTYVVTLAPPSGETIVYNNSATQPANQTGANKVTIYQCMKFDGDTRWYVSMGFYEA